MEIVSNYEVPVRGEYVIVVPQENAIPTILGKTNSCCAS